MWRIPALYKLPSLLLLLLMSVYYLQTFPANVGVMKRLKKLQLKDNHLSFLPPAIGECTMLEDLIIYR